MTTTMIEIDIINVWNFGSNVFDIYRIYTQTILLKIKISKLLKYTIGQKWPNNKWRVSSNETNRRSTTTTIISQQQRNWFFLCGWLACVDDSDYYYLTRSHTFSMWNGLWALIFVMLSKYLRWIPYAMALQKKKTQNRCRFSDDSVLYRRSEAFFSPQ